MRFSLGGELAFRSAPFDRTDAIIWSALDLGFQYPFRNIVPFVAGTANFGIAERYRFTVPSVDFAWQLGIEAGASVRPDAFIGLEVAAGIGRTVIGDQWSLNGWIRFGLAFF